MQKIAKVTSLLFIWVVLVGVTYVNFRESSFVDAPNGLGPAILAVVFFLLALVWTVKSVRMILGSA